MKRTVQFSFLFFALMMFLPFTTGAQDEKTNTITITITEDGKVTTDTTFKIAEGQDPDMVKRMVEDLAGGEVHIKARKDSYKKVMYTTGDDEETWDIYDINIDSIKEAHDGAHVMVMKTDDGNVKVKVLDEEYEDFDFESDEGESYIVKVVKEDEGDCEVKVTKGHHVIVSEDDKDSEHKVIIKEYKGEGGEGAKRVKVFISEDDEVMVIDEDEDLEWVEEDEEGGEEVIIIMTEDGEEKIIKKKKIKVEIKEDDQDNNDQEQEQEVVKKKKAKKKKE